MKHIKKYPINETIYKRLSSGKDKKVNEGTMGIDYTQLADDYIKNISKESDWNNRQILENSSSIREFAIWLNENMAL